MCEITPREIKRQAIKEKLAQLHQDGTLEPEMINLWQDFLDLDEEAQKALPLPHLPYPSVPLSPYPGWRNPWIDYWWNTSSPYKITITLNTSSGNYAVETNASTL